MSGSTKYSVNLARIAQKCQARYSSDKDHPFDLTPAGTTKPMFHMAMTEFANSVDSFRLVQDEITYLDCKARNGSSFNPDEKEFLVNLFEAMWWGGRARGLHEAGQLANHYVNGGGRPISISSSVYEGSSVVTLARQLMKEVLTEHYEDADAALSIKSTDQSVRRKIAALRRTKHFNQQTDGEIYANGILKAEEANKRLKYADNRFELLAQSRMTGASNAIKSVNITWKVESIWDYEPYESRPQDLTTLPVYHPGVKKTTPRETRAMLSEIFPAYMMIGGAYPNTLVLPDGLSNYMVQQGIAKEFVYTATWTETLEVTSAPKLDPNPGSKPLTRRGTQR